MTSIVGAVLLISTLSFWGGIIWLIVALFRKKSVKPPLGAVLLGMVLFAFGIGYVLSEISFIPDSTENVGAPEALETAEALDGYLRVELSDMFLRKADVLRGANP